MVTIDWATIYVSEHGPYDLHTNRPRLPAHIGQSVYSQFKDVVPCGDCFRVRRSLRKAGTSRTSAVPHSLSSVAKRQRVCGHAWIGSFAGAQKQRNMNTMDRYSMLYCVRFAGKN